MTTAGEFCNRTVYIVRGSDPLLDAARVMREHHVGDVVVVEEREGGRRVPVGILTDRDITVGVVAAAPEQLSSLRVGDVLTGRLVTAEEGERLEDAMKTMRQFGVRRVPVVGRDGALVGILAFDDVLEFIAEQLSDLARTLGRERQFEEQRRP